VPQRETDVEVGLNAGVKKRPSQRRVVSIETAEGNSYPLWTNALLDCPDDLVSDGPTLRLLTLRRSEPHGASPRRRRGVRKEPVGENLQLEGRVRRFTGRLHAFGLEPLHQLIQCSCRREAALPCDGHGNFAHSTQCMHEGGLRRREVVESVKHERAGGLNYSASHDVGGLSKSDEPKSLQVVAKP